MGKLGKIAIVGAGAVGSYYGARLAQAGEDVTFLLRSDYDHVKEHGLEVQSVAGDFHLENVQCERDSAAIGPVDLVIVAWKTTANSCAEKVIAPLIGENTAILTLQNGLANCEFLAGLFGGERIMAGLCFVCINRLESGVISHTASGLIRIGEYGRPVTPRLELINEVFNGANFPCEMVDVLEKAQWMKLVWNIPFNGLAIAEGGVDTDVLLNELKLEHKVRALMGEVVQCAAALGHEIPNSFIDRQIKITYPMGKYKPSSMIDFVDGKPIEVESIWEIPVHKAKALGVPVPEMEELLGRIQQRIAERDAC
ncbi:2-dehydropantoate 2-reductase [Rubritalea squalenifaciens DSM 18772]|uniref:2-dehydropantoate 2-reductase n=1 Tax=Rubritalea squalenifaciens DSM 18772 TaxID=1123071 RepID=A0A1M6P543_9BACT|nr:2-dehydropantoate 2-reductase [Rubritalea squalenifaciens]SHK03023.1 2-dehydropantoate 2-reductase [Rubritalea squalenifaciens DSM 18772]